MEGTRRSDLCYRQWDCITDIVDSVYGEQLRAIAGGRVNVHTYFIEEGEIIPCDQGDVPDGVKDIGAEVEKYVRGLRA